MTGRRVGAVAALLVLAGCAAGPTPPPAPPLPPPTSAAPFPGPPRPRDIPVGGILPCELLTEEQRAELGLDGEPQRYVSNTGLFGEARSCSIRRLTGGPALSVSITLSDTYGLERFFDEEVAAQVEPIVVTGFAAVLSRSDSTQDSCLVSVDVAAGQMVGVLLRDGGSAVAIPVDVLCEDVPRYANEVMATLLAR